MRHCSGIPTNPLKPLPASALVCALVRAGVLASVDAMPATAALAASIRTIVPEAHATPAARDILYLAQATDDGYGTVPHLRPRPETPVNRTQGTGTTTGAPGAGNVVPRTPVQAPPPPPPKDSRDSSR